MYHTHSDESYSPTSGASSKPGKGDIFAVGDAFTAALQQKGFAVSHDKTPHDPHDAGAYKRSRRTATKLFQQQPFALFDVHRDSAPGQAYSITIDGKAAQKVMIVIGRQNPKMSANLGVARTIKATADKKYPNLIRAIFMAKGGYNQDLDSQAILFEFGSDKLPLEQAKRSTAYIADAVAATFGVAPAPTPAPAPAPVPKLFSPAAPKPAVPSPGTPSPGKYVAPQQK
jgi:stage II sporulation protein P